MREPHSSAGVKLEVVEDADIHLGRAISEEALERRVCDPGHFIPYRVQVVVFCGAARWRGKVVLVIMCFILVTSFL